VVTYLLLRLVLFQQTKGTMKIKILQLKQQ
jgi:hypothetical protein